MNIEHNPYSATAIQSKPQAKWASRLARLTAIVLTSLLGVLTSAIALTDATREGYFEQDGLTFIAAVACLPAAGGTIAMCAVLRGPRLLFFV